MPRTVLNRDGEVIPFRRWGGRFSDEPLPPARSSWEKPPKFDEMIAVAERLAEGIDHVRVDLYEINGRIYFSELTPYVDSGHAFQYEAAAKFDLYPPYDRDEEIGSMWALPEIPFWKKCWRAMRG